MKLNKRKIFSIVMAGIAFLIIVFSFLPYVGYGSYHYSLWSSEAGTMSLGVVQLLLLLGVITLYLLHLFIDLKEKWVSYANYAVGFVTITHLIYFFRLLSGGSKVGFWFEFLLALALGACSVIWYFMSEEPFASKKTPIIGYDEKTGKPIYAKIKSYDPKTGKPIYEKD